MAAWRRPDVFPNDHPLYLGMTGLGSPATVRERLLQADALLVLGCRLNEIASFDYAAPGAETRWAHVDVEPRSGGSGLRAPDIALAADAGAFLRVARDLLAGGVLEAAVVEMRRAGAETDRAAFAEDFARIVQYRRQRYLCDFAALAFHARVDWQLQPEH